MVEIYKLASRFNGLHMGSKPVTGIHSGVSNTPSGILEEFAVSEGLTGLLRPSSGKLSWDAPALRTLLDKVVGLYKFGTLKLEGDKGKIINGITTYDKEAMESSAQFEHGLAAMKMVNYGDVEENSYPFETGRVLPPVLSGDRGRTGHMYFYNYMFIPTNAAHKTAAWDVIRLLVSPGIVKVKHRLNEGNRASGVFSRNCRRFRGGADFSDSAVYGC